MQNVLNSGESKNRETGQGIIQIVIKISLRARATALSNII